MKSNRRNPIWPYLGVLVCLFVLCVTAPRSWQRLEQQAELASREPLSLAPPARSTRMPVDAGAMPAPPATPAVEAVETSSASQAPTVATVEAPVSTTAGLALSIEAPDLSVDAPAPAVVEITDLPRVRLSDPSDRLAMRPARAFQPSMTLPPAEIRSAPRSVTLATDEPADWTAPQLLLDQFAELAEEPAAAAWATRTAGQVRQLTVSHAASDAPVLLAGLRSAAEEVDPLAAAAQSAALRTQLLRAKYALLRRLDLWEGVVAIRQAAPAEMSTDFDVSPRVTERVSEVAALTDEGDERGAAWRKYLLLDALQGTLDRGSRVSEHERRAVAQRVIARIAAARRGAEQRRFVEASPVAALDRALRGWTAEPVAPRQLLAEVEAYETSGAVSDAQRLAAAYQALRWSPAIEQRQLARQVEQHYRNANLRLVVSDAMLNRWLPAQPTVHARIQETILGANVRGRSATSTQLGVRLIPAYGKLQLGLQASGLVDTNTNSSSGPATLISRGKTHYLAEKLIDISPAGVQLAPATADARAHSDLLAINTDYDGVPVVRSLVRSVVASQHSDSHADALREMESRVAHAARERMDSEADQKVRTAVARAEQKVLAPLRKLSLEPTPLELQTTEDRLVMRLRLADDDQLGAHTPRPQALSDSVMSLQLHETALNNAVSQLKLDGQTFDLPELYEHIGGLLGVELTVPDDLPPRTRVTFAARDAIKLHLRDGLLRIELSLAEVAQGRRKYQNFKIRSFYRPETSGIHAQLVREDTVQLEGNNLGAGGQLVLRSVFSKIFSRNRPLPLIQPAADDARFQGLEISQLLLDDGWLGLSISPVREVVRRDAGGMAK